jgi:hypothetical protein
VIELGCVVFVTVVGPQVEVCTDLHLLGEQFIEISSEGRVSDSFEPIGLELRPEMVDERVRSGEFWFDAQSVETEVPSAQAPTRTS